MLRKRSWHGCLPLVPLFVVGLAGADEPVAVKSRVFDVDYSVNEASLPLEAVSLWFTSDKGSTWEKFGADEDRQSPMVFSAPDEGLFGLYLLAENATGPSSAAPTARTVPHLWLFVDETPPVIQLHALRQITRADQRILQIRWTAIDAHLGARPIDISYRRGSDATWYPIGVGRLANTGRYDWRLPSDLVDPISLRVSVVDLGGHRADSEPRNFESADEIRQTAPAMPVPEQIVHDAWRPETSANVSIETGANHFEQVAPAWATQRASRLYREAMMHSERGAYAEGIASLREAVKLKPKWADAFAQMANMFYLLGDLDRARDAYELALRQEPSMRAALRGLAMVHRRNNDYAAAATALRTVLRYDPNDVEVWLNLGDIAVYQGDDMTARECYLRATQTDPKETQVVADAQKRLELMSGVSRRYNPLPD